MRDEQRQEFVVVAFERRGAEALAAGAEVGLEGAPPDVVDVEAGWEAKEALQRVLATGTDAELLVLSAGLSALDDLMSHDPDMLVIDESDGVGLISGDAYRDLFALFSFLKDGRADLDDGALRNRIRTAIERGDDEFRAAEEKEEAHGIDDRHEHYVDAVVREFIPKEEHDGQ